MHTCIFTYKYKVTNIYSCAFERMCGCVCMCARLRVFLRVYVYLYVCASV